MRELEIKIVGRVQGVMFRSYLKEFADKNNLKGFVENKVDGSVFAVAQGTESDLKKFLYKIESGPGFSKVERLSYVWKDIVKDYPDFRIIRSKAVLIDKAESLVNLGKNFLGRNVEQVPKHIAIIPDGNRRWAKERSFGASYGHYKAGSFENLKSLIEGAEELGSKYLSIWAFSTENWKRSKKERDAIFNLIREGLEKFKDNFKKNEIRFRHIGRKDRLPRELVRQIEISEDETKNNDRFTVIFCLDYGGRDEIIRAVEKIVGNRKKSLSEEEFEGYLDTEGIPNPDLIIRTGGEKRLSGFMLYQGAYSELYFTDLYFPEFDSKELRKAILEYSRRQRRFGK